LLLSLIERILKKKIITALIVILAYFLFKHLIPFGGYVVYPFSLFVTFLHELGHALASVITGGKVIGVRINFDGSGYAVTAGGFRWMVIMGGYLGSIIFGNILLYVGFKTNKMSRNVLYVLIFLLLFVSFFWFESLGSSLILLAMSGALIFLVYKKEELSSTAILILGVISVLYIIEDFNVGPSSDLAKFAEYIPIFSAAIWMYVWLILALGVTFFNVRRLYKKISW